MLTKNRIARPVEDGSQILSRLAVPVLGIVVLIFITGCQTGSSSFMNVSPSASSKATTPANLHQAVVHETTNKTATTVAHSTTPPPSTSATSSAPNAYVLREGDTVKISFPGSPDLNTVQQIRTDGKINLPLVGEVDAAGLTTAELQGNLIKLYAPQLSTKAIVVEVQNASFPVYVTGAVLHPGKVTTNHSITALEAIMEAGGFDYTAANLKDVIVIRQEGDHSKRYKLNLKKAMNGGESKPFDLKPNDIIYVPQKFNWF